MIRSAGRGTVPHGNRRSGRVNSGRVNGCGRHGAAACVAAACAGWWRRSGRMICVLATSIRPCAATSGAAAIGHPERTARTGRVACRCGGCGRHGSGVRARRWRRSQRLACALATIGWLHVGAAGAAAIGHPERAARAGLAAYRSGDYEAATGAFATAAELRPGNAGLLYNAGAAAYQLGNQGDARRLLQASINNTPSHQLAAAGHLAIGHSWMADAEQQAQTDPAAALPALEAAVESYERTLRIDGDHDAAAYHLEQARVRLAELRRQMEQNAADGPETRDQHQQRQTGDGAERRDDTGSPEQAPDPEQRQQQQAPPDQSQPDEAAGAQAEPDSEQTNEEADSLARQIIAAEEALAAQQERRRQELEPVAQDW